MRKSSELTVQKFIPDGSRFVIYLLENDLLNNVLIHSHDLTFR